MAAASAPPSSAADAEPPEPAAAYSPAWRYRAEGGANVVVSVPQLGRVLRFPKTAHAEPAARLRRLAEYRNTVIAPLLAETVAVPWQLVRLSPGDLRRLSAAIEPQRPPRRRHVAINSGGLALSMEDCAVFPAALAATSPPQRDVFSVEIKAKQGFLAADDDLGVCSFCMKQYLKLKRASVTSVSGYCPLDLFSGQRRRVDIALRSLLDTPQNNLRVFRNGEFLYGSREGSADRQQLLEAVAAAALPATSAAAPPSDWLLQLWTHLMFTVLCTTEGDDEAGVATGSCPDGAADDCDPSTSACASVGRRCQLGSGPPAGSFLGRVLHGQRLAATGPTLTAAVYDQVVSTEQGRARVVETFAAPFSAPVWQRVLRESASDEGRGCAGGVSGDDPLLAMQRYSVGATLRDCSLMITMRRIDGPAGPDLTEGGRVVTDLAGGRWLCLCRVMDLDPKHIQRVSRQRLKKEKSRELYQRAQQPAAGRGRPGAAGSGVGRPGAAGGGVPIPCSVADDGIEHLLTVSGSPI